MTAPGPAAISLRDVRKRYGRRLVLDGVSFSVRPGTVVAMLGGNGAGKTTAIRCILGITPFEGSIEVAGRRVDRHGRDVRRMIGYMPQSPSLDERDTCDAALSFIAELRGVSRGSVTGVLDMVGLLPRRHARIGELSGGMRQRLALAAALLGAPPILLFDEPAASLDAESRAQFEAVVRELRRSGRTVLLSTHAHDGLERLVDQVVILHEGTVVFDGSIGDLTARLAPNRYVINLNGDAPAAALQALRGAGVRDDHIEPAPMRWEDVLRDVTERGPR